jgi:hypothetical protein
MRSTAKSQPKPAGDAQPLLISFTSTFDVHLLARHMSATANYFQPNQKIQGLIPVIESQKN